ncbi:hypothetical protein BCV72DRAFT_244179 [Rhizopus microsporus var. microsporus]|uniref:Uncharacterized protein n=2 Tax=Rhizopus microsporus TaxID=58291 RepID=A0A2G4T4Y7_RHIZD|nr:uncharacterized protein RHIMIDRAFT_265162 [Rhizopus microsporus ATCC 52813]ORE03701.1 hypothetical protein BCV72DRAFT_244179 [Rhizopus microsporus var. microsporus]PHZ16084.1 hypothetical protein RHIMIDRAFT_265162 [Rhizopus microsporus ATCC 52813]
MTDYMEKNGEKGDYQLWIDFIKKHFQSTAETLKENNLAFPQETSSSKKEATATSKECEYRTCSISVNKAKRKDSPKSVADIVDKKTKYFMFKINDYCARFFVITQIMASNTKKLCLYYKK